MKTCDRYDIERSSFEDFVAFLFEHDVVPPGGGRNQASEPWYWHAEVAFDARKVLRFYRRLFEDPQFLFSRYARDQLEQGFWAIISRNLACSVAEVIWDRGVSFEARAACVRSMYDLYERFFATDPLETSSNMWWDVLAYDWHCGNRARAKGGDDEAMQDVMFETLVRILALPSRECQTAALHGLGHLHHPETQQAIVCYLEGAVSPDLREYALAASRFQVL